VSSIDLDGHTLLYDAYDKPIIVSCLLGHKIDVNQRSYNGKVALMASASYLNINKKTKEVIKLLLQAGGDVNAVDNDNKSVLHYYASGHNYFKSSDKVELLSLFISYGAKINAIDNNGKTPFDYAQENNDEQLMELLRIGDQETTVADIGTFSPIIAPWDE
jgi:ankyrin repeat protein